MLDKIPVQDGQKSVPSTCRKLIPGTFVTSAAGSEAPTSVSSSSRPHSAGEIADLEGGER